MATVNDFINAISPLAKSVKRFKIGKTGQTISERFRQEHEKNYNSIRAIGVIDNKKETDEYEIALIKYFKFHYSNCDNQQEGGGEMTPSGQYHIYVVYN